MTTIYVTKYALTKGIQKVDAELSEHLAMWRVNGWCQYAHNEGRDWHRTQGEAEARAAEMRDSRVASLKKSIAKLERTTTFEIVAVAGQS